MHNKRVFATLAQTLVITTVLCTIDASAQSQLHTAVESPDVNTSRSSYSAHYTANKRQKLSPQLRAQAITTQLSKALSPAYIQPFLGQSIIISPGDLDNAPTVIESREEGLLINSQTEFYVQGIDNITETMFRIYRPNLIIQHPKSQIALGQDAVFIGHAQLLRRDGTIGTFVVTDQTQEVRSGDKLVAGKVPIRPPKRITKPASLAAATFITQLANGLDEAAQNDIVIVSSGIEQGVLPGQVYNTVIADRSTEFQGARIDLPDTVTGQLVIISSFDTASYALLTQSSRAISLGDQIKPIRGTQ